MDYDKILDQALYSIEFRKVIAEATQINKRIRTILENLEYMDSKGRFNLPETSE